jgi:hypothetical protein
MSDKKPPKTQPVEEQLMIALACGATLEGAAAKAGVSERTVYRRLEDPQFRQRLQSFRLDMVERAGAMLTAASMEAVKTLLGLTDRSYPPAIRLAASRAVLELGIKLRDLYDVEKRLAALESRILPKEGDATRQLP